MRRLLLTLATALTVTACSPADLVLQAGGRAAEDAQWALDPEAGPVPPDATAVPVLVMEVGCASGRMADGRIRVRDVAYLDDRIEVVIGVVPPEGDQDCQGNPLTPYLLELDEPVGDRDLVNGSTHEIASRPIEGLAGEDGPEPEGAEPEGSLLIEADDPDLGERDVFLVEALWFRAYDHSEFGDLGDLSPHPGGVLLVLGESGFSRKVRGAELADPASWVLDPDEPYAGATGPFDVLEVLTGTNQLLVTLGDHPHCAGPPRAAPSQLADFRRIGIQPAGTESCLQWFSVDLYVDDQDRLRGVVLDLWEP